MAHVYRGPFNVRKPQTPVALLFPAGLSGTIVMVAAASVSVTGQALTLIARLAVNVRRFFVSLNDING